MTGFIHNISSFNPALLHHSFSLQQWLLLLLSQPIITSFLLFLLLQRTMLTSSFPLLFLLLPLAYLQTPIFLFNSLTRNTPHFFQQLQEGSRLLQWPLQSLVERPRKVKKNSLYVFICEVSIFGLFCDDLFCGVAVIGLIKLALEAGKATPAPPVGPALGSKGVNIMAFCKDYNARTADKAGYVIPVEITVYDVRIKKKNC